MRYSIALPILLLAGAANAAAPDLGACAAIDADRKRLACYDRLAGRPGPGSKKAESVAEFGAESVSKTADLDQLDEISARIAGEFAGWKRGTRLELDNGQLWQSVDDRELYVGKPLPRPKVTIRRGLFGAYYLAVEGFNSRAKVKRLR